MRRLPNGQTQLFIGLHLIHEVTSPQAFDMLRARGGRVRLSGADVRHRRSHRADARSAAAVLDVMAEDMLSALERNCREAASRCSTCVSGAQGIVHVIGPELG